MRRFLCPVCGSFHRVSEENCNMVFSCTNCKNVFMLKDDGLVRPLTPAEIDSIDSGSMLGIPGKFRMGRGTPIPMLDGGNANFRIGDQLFHIPEQMSTQDILYRALCNGFTAFDIKDLLDMGLPQECCEVDVHRLQVRLVKADWDWVNEQYHFLVE